MIPNVSNLKDKTSKQQKQFTNIELVVSSGGSGKGKKKGKRKGFRGTTPMCTVNYKQILHSTRNMANQH